MTAGALVQPGLVERVAQEVGVARASRVAPHIDGRHRLASAVKTAEAVPERGDADTAHGRAAGARAHGIEARRDGGEEHAGIVLDAAVTGEMRLVGRLMIEAGDGPPVGVVGARAG